jgi:hypothetical protein
VCLAIQNFYSSPMLLSFGHFVGNIMREGTKLPTFAVRRHVNGRRRRARFGLGCCQGGSIPVALSDSICEKLMGTSLRKKVEGLIQTMGVRGGIETVLGC